jgi:NADPH2 dehydrogenase
MPSAQRLFSPLHVGRMRLRNRLVMEALSSGHATPEGFIDAQLHQFYQERARGGVGALIIETCLPLPPVEPIRHLGLYADAHVPGLRACIRAIQDEGCGVLVMLDQPGGMRDLAEQDIVETFLHLCEPGIGEIRLATMLHVVEACIGWLGRRCIVGVRLAVEEHVPGGLTLQDTRVVARRLTSAGARLIEITVRVGSDAVVAQFPGWQTPVAAAVKAVVEAPVIVGGELDDVVLAEYALLDSCADLIAVGERLRVEPDWPLKIQALAKR